MPKTPLKTLQTAIYQNDIEAIYAHCQETGPHVLVQFFELERPPADILKDFKALVEKGVILKDVLEESSGNTLLHYATHKRDETGAFHPLVTYLIQQGCSVNAQNKDWETSIHCALKVGNYRAVFLCFETQEVVDVTLVEKKEHKSYLHFSFQFKFTVDPFKLIPFLIQKGCAVNAKDSKEMTPLQALINYLKEGSEDVQPAAMILLNAEGIDLNVIDGGKNNLLHMAVSLKLAWLVEVLLERAPKLQYKENATGKTPLMLSMENLQKQGAIQQELKIIEPLLRAGSMVDHNLQVQSAFWQGQQWLTVKIHFLMFLYCYFPEQLEKVVKLCQAQQLTQPLLPFCKSSYQPLERYRSGSFSICHRDFIKEEMEKELRALGELEVRSAPVEQVKNASAVGVLPFQGYTIIEQVAFFELMHKGKGSYTANWRAFLNRDRTLDATVRAACQRFLGAAKKALHYTESDKNLMMENALSILNLEALVYKNIHAYLNRSWVRKVIEVFAAQEHALLPQLVVQALAAPDSFLAVTLKSALRAERDFEKRRWFSDLSVSDQTKVRNFMENLVLLEAARPAVIVAREGARSHLGATCHNVQHQVAQGFLEGRETELLGGAQVQVLSQGKLKQN